jgi:hypothetical protein
MLLNMFQYVLTYIGTFGAYSLRHARL